MISGDKDEEDDDENLWLLGLLDEPDDKFSLLRHRFPSKIGGRPAWLNPINLPAEHQLRSKESGKSLDFLLQVYCPVDGNALAFHRTVFVFIPQDGKDLRRAGNVRAFRSQLPRKNEFYGHEPAKNKFPRELPATRDCTDPWLVGEAEACLANGNPLPEPHDRQLYPEHFIVIEEEQPPSPPQKSQGRESDGAMQASDVSPDVEAAIASNTTPEQKHFAGFAARVSWEPEQVLRYCFQDGVEPLWPSPSPIPKETDIPPCPLCSGKRKFEFQVMPQLLSSLDIDDEQDSALDWGTIAIYSCSASCDVQSAYAEEFVWVQT